YPPSAGQFLCVAPRAEPNVAGQLVRVFERLLQERVAGLEVVVDERGRHARGHRDPRDADIIDAVARNALYGRGENALARPAVGLGRAHSRSALIRSANQAIAPSRCDRGPSSRSRVSRPACTFATRSASSDATMTV